MLKKAVPVLVLEVELGLSLLVVHVLVQHLEVGCEGGPILNLKS